ncbi:MAG: hypothetical protein K2H97_08490 [Prevotella sp.]|nr:hypothetical protein [Prevotella sp.]
MKKIAFMFAAAAMCAACTSTAEQPATDEVEVIDEIEAVVPVLTAEDSAAVAAMFEGQEVCDSALQAAYDSILAAKTAVEEVAEEVAEEVEATVEE